MSMEKLNEYIKNKRANNSRAREAIYNLLIETDECLSVAQMLKRLSMSYPKKISQNTLYRHLNFFINGNLVIVIQDNLKRAYYYLKEDALMTFCICTRCNKVSKLNLDYFASHDELKTADFITVHKVCAKCI